MFSSSRFLSVFMAGALATAGMTSGCTNQPYTSSEQQSQNACQAFGPKAMSGALLGTLAGAAGGAGIGALAGRGRGAAIGGLVGGLAGLAGGLAVGKNMDSRDCTQAQTALAQVRQAQIGQVIAWRSPSGSYGSYTPISAEYAGANNQFCRSLNENTTIQGHQPTTSSVVTCRTGDGDYQTVQPAPT